MNTSRSDQTTRFDPTITPTSPISQEHDHGNALNKEEDGLTFQSPPSLVEKGDLPEIWREEVKLLGLRSRVYGRVSVE
jgi:hypothetical protein